MLLLRAVLALPAGKADADHRHAVDLQRQAEIGADGAVAVAFEEDVERVEAVERLDHRQVHADPDAVREAGEEVDLGPELRGVERTADDDEMAVEPRIDGAAVDPARLRIPQPPGVGRDVVGDAEFREPGLDPVEHLDVADGRQVADDEGAPGPGSDGRERRIDHLGSLGS